MWDVITAGIWARKRRLLGAGVSVILGVAFLAATLLIGDTMRAGFDEAFSELNAGTDVMVRSSAEMGEETTTRDLVADELVADVAAVDGVTDARPVIEGLATIVAADGSPLGGQGPPTIGTNWIDDPAVNPYRVAEGRAPEAPGEVVIDRRSARDGDLGVGDHTTVLTPGPVDVEVVGIVTFGDQDSLGPTTYTAFTLDGARAALLGGQPGVSGILVTADDGVAADALRADVAGTLPERVEAITGTALVSEQNEAISDDFLGFFRMILVAFAGIALVVATFSIHNTFSILVAQRTRESALLRAIGATRRQVVVAVAGEALAVGVVAAAIGLGAGLGLATGLVALMESAGFSPGGGGLTIEPMALVTAVVVGVVVALAASVGPAVRTSRVAPLAALRDVAVDRSGRSWRRAVLGALLTLGGIVAVATATATADAGGAFARTGLGGLALVAGLVVFGPIAAGPAAAALGHLVDVRNTLTGRLARSATRTPGRVASSAAALMVGTAVVAVFTTFGASLEQTIETSVDGFDGDLVIMPEGFSGASLAPELAPALAASPEVDAAVGVAFAVAEIDGAGVEPAATDPAAFAAQFDLDVTAGSVAEMAPGEIAVSTRYVEDHDVTVGDQLPLTFLDGATTELTVAAVYADRFTFGDLLMTTADWAPHARQTGDTVVFAALADGVDLATGRAAVDATGRSFGAPAAETRDEYLDSQSAQIDQMLTLVYGLLAIAIVIALLGIANTLSLSIHERTRELGLLRAVGQSRWQVRSMVRREAVVIALFGALGGIGVGSFLGWGLMRAFQAQEGVGAFALPVTSLAVIAVLAAGAGVLAAVRPARRASRLDVLAALATD